MQCVHSVGFAGPATAARAMLRPTVMHDLSASTGIGSGSKHSGFDLQKVGGQEDFATEVRPGQGDPLGL